MIEIVRGPRGVESVGRTAPSPEPPRRACPACAGPALLTLEVIVGSTVGRVFCCERCGHLERRLAAGDGDPPAVVDAVRRMTYRTKLEAAR